MRGSSTLPEFVPKTKGSRFGAMILELKTGRKRNGELKRIKHTRESTVIRSPQKKRTSHERFANTSGVRSENRRFQIWRNDFGDKNGAQANKGSKRIEHTRKSPSSVPHKKRTSHERFANTSGVRSENQGFQIWRNDFGAKNGAQAKQRVEAY